MDWSTLAIKIVISDLIKRFTLNSRFHALLVANLLAQCVSVIACISKNFLCKNICTMSNYIKLLIEQMCIGTWKVSKSYTVDMQSRWKIQITMKNNAFINNADRARKRKRIELSQLHATPLKMLSTFSTCVPSALSLVRVALGSTACMWLNWHRDSGISWISNARS